jgi:cytochrome c oxidase subunit 1
VAGVVAIVGGGLYIAITVGTILFGKKLDVGQYTSQRTVLKMPVAAALTGHGGHGGGFAAPGTFVFALVFLAAFVLYYFVNWKYLSTVWGLS